MKYYVTIYIDQLLEIELITSFVRGNGPDFTHAFIGLTKDKSPDELDKIDREIESKKVKNKDWNSIDYKWYHSKTTDEYNDGFWGFGSGNESLSAPGKVFANNQYIVNANKKTNTYNEKKLRNTQTFSYNRCILEISKEQYQALLADIKQDYEYTKSITPNTKEGNENFKYDIARSNCLHWVIKKLSNIGVEVADGIGAALGTGTIPGMFMDIFEYIKFFNSIFLKFQQIDKDLESLAGARAFRDWAREMINNRFVCDVTLNDNKIMPKYNIKCSSENNKFEELIAELFIEMAKLKSVYSMLDRILSAQIQKAQKLGFKQLQGSFILISYNKHNGAIQLRSKSHNNYSPYSESELDPNIPSNNWTLNKFAPYILNLKDNIISRCIYKNYTYPHISQGYREAINNSYISILNGNDNLLYWSSSLHKLRKSLNKESAIKDNTETIEA